MTLYPTITLITFLCVIATQSTSKYERVCSQYKGVYWHKQIRKWYVLIFSKGQKGKYGGYFSDELDAAKRVNQICQELGIPLQNPEISATPNQQYRKKEKTSQFKGVTWHKERRQWCARLSLKGQKQMYCGRFNDELDAAKRVNELCEKFGVPQKNPSITAIQNRQYQTKEKTSQYKGVSYDKQTGKWYARVCLKGEKQKYGGIFNDELEAAKRVNQLCNKFGIPQQNPTISAISSEQYKKKEKKSQYKGVGWHRKTKKWYVLIRINEKRRYGGQFTDELDAAKRANQLCEKLGIPIQNPEISATPNQQYQKKEKTSKYKGVTWHKDSRKWYVQLRLKQGKSKYGGIFTDELDAAKRMNQLCEEMEIPLQNPEISAIPNQQLPKNCKTLLDDAAMQAEFEDLFKIFDQYNDPNVSTMKENIIAAINHDEQNMMKAIDLRTKNGESALSIAAKHGFSHAVEFLISKGANKEHFTDENHTPLSLAVSQNYLKVVQVLFQDWISPNSHKKPYVHMSPIFNVKSREIAQLLIDNDAVTHKLYNNKKQSPLTVACQNGYLDVVEFFLDDGLDINHLDKYNKTPLFYALTNNYQDVANLLTSKGAKK